MKKMLYLLFLHAIVIVPMYGQNSELNNKLKKELYQLIDNYSKAREERDTILLKRILTPDIDQLVSTGEWRAGIRSSVKGMLNSSAGNPGSRKLTVEKIKLIQRNSAIIDCKYEIQNADGTIRRMWSTFVVVSEKEVWKISAIRNMLPTN